ncbi:MAG TPA: hypothetical protein VLD67_04815 [Vicinamibacterales bacterium]|nr:hypothetical protein [Vicinamibacterales bacterium]
MFLIPALLLTAAQVPAPADASKLALDSAKTVAIVDMDKIDGEPWQISWSPDAQQLYLAAMKRTRTGMDLKHHLLDVATGKVKKIDAEPDWAAKYWAWKNGKTAPGNPAFEIALDIQKKNVSATARPMGGALARGGVDPGSTGIPVDEFANQPSQNVEIISMLLKGEVIGRWEGPPIVPGLTYGWGPAGTGTIAFANLDGRLVLMDEQGRKQEIDSTKDVRLPAWSDDGRRLAWAEKQDRKKFRIQIAGVSGA